MKHLMQLHLASPGTFDGRVRKPITPLIGKTVSREERINKVAEQIAKDHYDVTQEPALTSRLAQEIESEVRRHPVNAGTFKLEVATQDLPDRGGAP